MDFGESGFGESGTEPTESA